MFIVLFSACVRDPAAHLSVDELLAARQYGQAYASRRQRALGSDDFFQPYTFPQRNKNVLTKRRNKMAPSSPLQTRRPRGGQENSFAMLF